MQLNSTEKEKCKTGSRYAVVDLPRSAVDESQWFCVRITVQGKHITVQLNDRTTVDYTEPDNVQRPPERAGRKLNPGGGAIALQRHDPGSTFLLQGHPYQTSPVKAPNNSWLTVHAALDTHSHAGGIKVSDEELCGVRLTPAQFHGEWN